MLQEFEAMVLDISKVERLSNGWWSSAFRFGKSMIRDFSGKISNFLGVHANFLLDYHFTKLGCLNPSFEGVGLPLGFELKEFLKRTIFQKNIV